MNEKEIIKTIAFKECTGEKKYTLINTPYTQAYKEHYTHIRVNLEELWDKVNNFKLLNAARVLIKARDRISVQTPIIIQPTTLQREDILTIFENIIYDGVDKYYSDYEERVERLLEQRESIDNILIRLSEDIDYSELNHVTNHASDCQNGTFFSENTVETLFR